MKHINEVLNNLYRKIESITRDERYISLLVCFLIAYEPVRTFFLLTVIKIYPFPNNSDFKIVTTISIIVIILALRKIIVRIRYDHLIILLFFGLQWGLAWVLNDGYSAYYKQIGHDLFIVALPAYLLVRSVKDYDKLYKYYGIAAIVVTISMLITIFVYSYSDIFQAEYSPTTAYRLIPAALISISFNFRKINLIHLANAIIASGLIFMAGTRAPLVTLVLFIIMKTLLVSISSLKRFIWIGITSIISFFTLVKFWDPIMQLSQRLVNKVGVSDRLVVRLMDKSLFVDTTRMNLYKTVVSLISDNKLFGVGLAKDRILLIKTLEKPAIELYGWYPHNVFLEILLQYGIILGGILLLLLSYLFINALIKTKNRGLVDLIVIFFALGVFSLLFSDSYLRMPYFFAFVGFCVSAYLDNHKKVIDYNIESDGIEK